MTDREAMQLALDALQEALKIDSLKDSRKFELVTAPKAMAALRQALEQPEQEPVASWRNAALRLGEDLYSVGPNGYYDMTASQWLDWALSVVNTTPPQREWVGLTDEEVDCLEFEIGHDNFLDFARAIEAKLKERNHGY